MNTFFVGQTSMLGQTASAKRVRALAQSLAAQNHTVTAFSATEKQTRRLEQLAIRYIPSLSPEHPGGWLYTALSMLVAILGKADVIHLMSWKAAALAPWAVLFNPEATFIWTAESLPAKDTLRSRIVVFLAVRLCDAITTPTRSLQYAFRIRFNILPTYIPDGFASPTLKDIAATHWKLRKGAYTLVIAENTDALRIASLAYNTTKSRKKLIALVPAFTPTLKRLKKRYSFLKLVESTTPRQRASLIRQAGIALFLDDSNTEEFLLAMGSGQRVLAANVPLLQEIAGTTVEFFKTGDQKHLAELLQQPADTTLARKAQKRAQAHFSWNRIFEEYETLYHYPLVRRVSVDSIQSRTTHGAAY